MKLLLLFCLETVYAQCMLWNSNYKPSSCLYMSLFNAGEMLFKPKSLVGINSQNYFWRVIIFPFWNILYHCIISSFKQMFREVCSLLISFRDLNLRCPGRVYMWSDFFSFLPSVFIVFCNLSCWNGTSFAFSQGAVNFGVFPLNS